MSVALMFDYPNNDSPQQDDGYLRPVSTEKIFYKYWDPVIQAEGYPWLHIISPGIDFDAENLPEVLAELRQLQAAFPRYYTPDDEKYGYIMSHLADLITELEGVNPDDLASGKLELFLG